MGEAIFGLVGVLIGGMLNVAGGWFGDHRRERKERRTAARLLIPELVNARIGLAMMLRYGRWWAAEFPRERWEAHEATLARITDDIIWRDLSAVYLSLQLFEDERPKWSEDDPDPPPSLQLPKAEAQVEEEWLRAVREELEEMSSEDVEHVRLTLDSLEAVIERLSKFAGVRVADDTLVRSAGS